MRKRLRLGVEHLECRWMLHGGHGETSELLIVDFGGGQFGDPIAGMNSTEEPREVAHGDLPSGLFGTQRLMVLRVYFQDYAATSLLSKTEVEEVFGDLDQLWQDTSYGNINVESQVSGLFQLPGVRSDYIDDLSDGDLSNDGKFDKVLNDAIANAPNNLDWTDIDAVFVIMAETSSSQFHRGQATSSRNLRMGPGGDVRNVGAGIFSENPSENDLQRWGRWAHELGHAFQGGGPAHPSNYQSEFELMDANYPGQVGAVGKFIDPNFASWMPDSKYRVFSPFGSGGPGEGGGIANLWATEYRPDALPNYQAVKVDVTNDFYYMVSVRRRVLGDDLNGGFTPPGIPDEGVLIEQVEVGGDPWVTLMSPPGRDRNSLWKAGESFSGRDVVIDVEQKLDAAGDNYRIRVRYTNEFGSQADIGMEPWISAPGNTYETTDIWVDSPVNGFDDGSFDPGSFSYGVWNDLSGNPVPVGNGDVPAIGQNNRLYARVRNFGIQSARDVVVHWDLTDPAIAGAGPNSPWSRVGSVSKDQFPQLASIPGGSFVDVYIEWTPDFPIPEETLEDGAFQLHRCIRVVIDPVSSEFVLGNQDGDDEQENIFTFQAIPPTTGTAAAPLTGEVLLYNASNSSEYYHLTYESTLPANWDLSINGGDLGIRLGPHETRRVPVAIQPVGQAVLGSVFDVKLYATSLVEFVNELDHSDRHLAYESTGGVVVQSRVQRRPSITLTQLDRHVDGTIQIRGRFSVQGFSSLFDAAHPFRVMVKSVDLSRRFENAIMTVVEVGADGTFAGTLLDPTPNSPTLEVVAQFAGTTELAAASTGYVNTRVSDFYYGFDRTSSRLIRINAATGAFVTAGLAGTSEWMDGLVLTNDGTLYGHSADLGEFGGNSFYRIDRLTGAVTRIGGTNTVVGGGLAYDPIRDQIFTTTPSTGVLVRINRNTGRGTTIGSGIAGLNSPTAAAFDVNNDRLLVFDNADNQIYAFDPENGDATRLSTAAASLSVTAMTFNGSNLIIHDANSDTVRRLNPDTGTTSTLFSVSPALDLRALEFIGAIDSQPMLGIDFANATLFDVDSVTGAISNPRPTNVFQGANDTIGIAFAADHSLYTINATKVGVPSTLFRLDRTTGEATAIGPTGLSISEGDLAFDVTTNQLYGLQASSGNSNQRSLFTVDLTSGAATAIADIGVADYSAMAFDDHGRLFVLDSTDDDLLMIDKATGSVLTRVALSRTLGSNAGMAFHPETGVLYVSDGGTSGTDTLYTLSTTSGILTPQGTTGLARGLAGLSFVPTTGVIRGKVFDDQNGNGRLEGSLEPGIADQQIFLDYDADGVHDPIVTTVRPGAGGAGAPVGTIPFPAVISGLVAPITDLNVTINLSHPIMSTLGLSLISPRGTSVELFSPGQVGGNRLQNTVFDDEATNTITVGQTGRFQARGVLSDFDGEDPNGVWYLLVQDVVNDAFLAGLTGWTLEISHGETLVTTDAHGDFLFTQLVPQDYRVSLIASVDGTQTTPWNRTSHSVRVTEGRTYLDRNFGLFHASQINGVIFDDSDGNGVRGVGEAVLAGRDVFLDFNNNRRMDPIAERIVGGVTGIIPDGATFAYPLVVAGAIGPTVDLEVLLSINHPDAQTLDAYLISPRGTRVELVSPGHGINLTSVRFSDQGQRAEGRLAAFQGEEPNGAWYLVITDPLVNQLQGIVVGWNLVIRSGERTVTTNDQGTYQFDLAFGTYSVVAVAPQGWAATVPQDSTHVVTIAPREVLTASFGQSPVTEPGPEDLNRDGIVDGTDLDLLFVFMQTMGYDLQYDLNNDNQVNILDRDTWLELAGRVNLPGGRPYLLGDINLDGQVDASDASILLPALFTADVAWTKGNLNGDAVIDVSDFNLLSVNKFRTSHSNAAGASSPVRTPRAATGTTMVAPMMERPLVACASRRASSANYRRQTLTANYGTIIARPNEAVLDYAFAQHDSTAELSKSTPMQEISRLPRPR